MVATSSFLPVRIHSKMERDELDSAKEALLDDNDDDLEFHITFPSPTGRSATPDRAPTSTSTSTSAETSPPPSPRVPLPRLVGREDPEPVVFLLGWSGCQDKELSEYSRLYEELGCATVRYTAPAEYLFLSPSRIPPLARKLVDLVPEMSLEASPVFVHAFGNNGACVYQHMAELLLRADVTSSSSNSDSDGANHAAVRRQLRGVIFDSCPGQRTAAAFLRAASDSLGAQGYSVLLTLVLPPFMLLLAHLLRLLGFLSGLLLGSVEGEGEGEGDAGTGVGNGGLDQTSSLWCYEYLSQGLDRPRAPCLFLHSASDSTVSPSEVAAAAEARADAAGVEMDRVCFDDGEHVGLLGAHREAYVSAVVSFVSKSLRREHEEEEEKQEDQDGGQQEARVDKNEDGEAVQVKEDKEQ